MLETVAMGAAVVILFMVRVVMEDMVVIATPVKAEMVVTEGIVFSIKVETAVTVVMDLKVEAKEAAVVQALWGKEAMDKMAKKNKGLKMKSRFVSTMLFGLLLVASVSMTACDTKECNSQEPNTCESTRAKDGENGADGSGNADGQDGGHGQKGILGQDGGQGGNGGNSDFGKGGNGGNGGDVD